MRRNINCLNFVLCFGCSLLSFMDMHRENDSCTHRARWDRGISWASIFKILSILLSISKGGKKIPAGTIHLSLVSPLFHVKKLSKFPPISLDAEHPPPPSRGIWLSSASDLPFKSQPLLEFSCHFFSPFEVSHYLRILNPQTWGRKSKETITNWNLVFCWISH